MAPPAGVSCAHCAVPHRSWAALAADPPHICLMTTCGVDISGSRAVLVLLTGTATSHTVVDPGFRHLSVDGAVTGAKLRSFRDTFDGMVQRHSIAQIAIKGRAGRGRFAGGPVGFKLEALIQLNPNVQVLILASATITAALRDHQYDMPFGLTAYQHDAYRVAYAHLRRHS